jgi:Ras-related GTP-binding protein C/D
MTSPLSLPVQTPTSPIANPIPRILLLGLRRSGKSSIHKVVFQKMSPNETLFLESTSKVAKFHVDGVVSFDLYDVPGQIQDAPTDVYREHCAVVFVIDAQDEYVEALNRLLHTISTVHSANPNVGFEVFIHKVDGLSDDHKIETQREIHQRITDDLMDLGLDHGVALSFYQTSIYDHSVFEAFSKVIQKLIPELPTLENLLNILCSSSGIDKAFLFDVNSKIYIATDSSPVDMPTYELCSDMIDVVMDIGSIYDASEAVGENSSDIRLGNGTVLTMRLMPRHLALVCLMREECMDSRGLIDVNFGVFEKAMDEIFSEEL